MNKREMSIRDWNGKKIVGSTWAEDDTWHIAFEDGTTAILPSEGIGILIPEKLCNLCALPCKLENDLEDASGLIDAVVAGGYASTPGNGNGALDDCTRYHFSLCEFCLDWLFTQFQLPPVVSSYTSSEFEDFRPAAQRVKEDDWRGTKERFFKEFEKRNAARNKK